MGVSNSSSVREALDTLKTIDIDVPVWDTATGSGNNTQSDRHTDRYRDQYAHSDGD